MTRGVRGLGRVEVGRSASEEMEQLIIASAQVLFLYTKPLEYCRSIPPMTFDDKY